MRAFEISAALILAAVIFVALEIVGLVLKFALVAAAIGFAAGLVIAAAWRRRSF